MKQSGVKSENSSKGKMSSFSKKIQKGFQMAVNNVILEARKENRSLAISRDGVVELVPAKKLRIVKVN